MLPKVIAVLPGAVKSLLSAAAVALAAIGMGERSTAANKRPDPVEAHLVGAQRIAFLVAVIRLNEDVSSGRMRAELRAAADSEETRVVANQGWAAIRSHLPQQALEAMGSPASIVPGYIAVPRITHERIVFVVIPESASSAPYRADLD